MDVWDWAWLALLAYFFIDFEALGEFLIRLFRK